MSADVPPTLEYSPTVERGVRIAPWLRKILIAIAAILFIYVAGSLIPRERTTVAESCAICAGERMTQVTHLAGWKVGSRQWTNANSGFLYDQLIGEPHAHRWMQTATSTGDGNLWGYGGVACGGSRPVQIEVTEAAIVEIHQSFLDLSIKQRRDIYARLRACADEKAMLELSESIQHHTSIPSVRPLTK